MNGPTVSWLEPPARACALKNDRLVVVAASTKKVKNVTFTDGSKRIGVDKTGSGGIYSVPWKTTGLAKGTRHLLATVTDAAGNQAASSLDIKICK